MTTENTQGNDLNQENILLNFFCFRNIFETAIRYWKLACVCAVLGWRSPSSPPSGSSSRSM